MTVIAQLAIDLDEIALGLRRIEQRLREGDLGGGMLVGKDLAGAQLLVRIHELLTRIEGVRMTFNSGGLSCPAPG